MTAPVIGVDYSGSFPYTFPFVLGRVLTLGADLPVEVLRPGVASAGKSTGGALQVAATAGPVPSLGARTGAALVVQPAGGGYVDRFVWAESEQLVTLVRDSGAVRGAYGAASLLVSSPAGAAGRKGQPAGASLLVVAASWLQSDLRGEYDPAAEYEPGQVVSYGGVYYVRVGGRAAGNPPGGAYWRQAAPAVSALAYFTAGSNFLPFFGM
jgi:hypothetical protein